MSESAIVDDGPVDGARKKRVMTPQQKASREAKRLIKAAKREQEKAALLASRAANPVRAAEDDVVVAKQALVDAEKSVPIMKARLTHAETALRAVLAERELAMLKARLAKAQQAQPAGGQVTNP